MNWFRSRKTDPLVSELAGALKDLREEIKGISTPDDDLPETSNPMLVLIERQDSIENRFEELRGTVLRQLQSASQRLKKAEDLDPFREEDPELPAMPIPTNGAPEEPETAMEYGARILRERGQTPMA